MSYAAFDNLERRCPKLGHEVNFGYCRACESGLPCSRCIQCFEEMFPASAYFSRVLKPETFQRIFILPSEERVHQMFRVASAATSEEPTD